MPSILQINSGIKHRECNALGSYLAPVRCYSTACCTVIWSYTVHMCNASKLLNREQSGCNICNKHVSSYHTYSTRDQAHHPHAPSIYDYTREGPKGYCGGSVDVAMDIIDSLPWHFMDLHEFKVLMGLMYFYLQCMPLEWTLSLTYYLLLLQ